MNLSLETLVIKAFSEVWNVDIDKVKNLDEKNIHEHQLVKIKMAI